MDKVQRAGQNNRLSVALELQADCYAGIWANFAAKQGRVEAGDTEEAIRAAQAVGDDMIQKRTQGYVVPEIRSPMAPQTTGAVLCNWIQIG